MSPIVVGLLAGGGMAALMAWRGMLRDPGALAVAVAAIAAFWPVFAVDAGQGVVLHLVVAALFVAIAVAGYPRYVPLLGVALLAHGAFDLTQLGTAIGPAWWPGVCAGFDVALGGAVLAVRG